MASEESERKARARESIVHASGPILNGGITSLIGVIVLLFSESYIFQSFFKIMVLVIGFGTLHAVALIPVVLSFIGPAAHAQNTGYDVTRNNGVGGNKNGVKHNGMGNGVKNGISNGISNGKANSNSQENGKSPNNGSMTYTNQGFEYDANLGYLK